MNNPSQNAAGHDIESDHLDQGIDAALLRYQMAEPRIGLEERVLANLHAQPHRDAAVAWWYWPTSVAALAAIAVVLTLAFRPTHRQVNVAQQVPRIKTTPASHPDIRTTAPPELPRKSQRQPKGTPGATLARAVSPNYPRLDQFPSPQPLSDQEKLLENYVRRYPENAALIAEARTEALRRDLEDEMKAAQAKP